MKIINSKTIHPSVRELLSFATSDFKVDLEYQMYLKSLNRKLYCFELQEEIIGCIGIEIISFNECVIKHIAVSSEHRGKGIGSRMIEFLSEEFTLITAETDKDAVDFYRKYGFSITSLGEKYPGVERFLCDYIT
ncbi:GNAT family N-acetyltransferase (plasmid) [Metabacillus halosaccharovorans]|uniref:GNAT family N-acetyltransferase n=1 Tax=Metabacillus halosaccharovorans TaxID=930124 RepID=UPI001C200DFA|nr:N-acetyltransferase [Metabacillus halosaccharovorans]MBU7595841.1 GNAT family N-acetyltransferase [Metabacillus halosaccharovorans]MCM3441450.1 GNAT family N-acetyltransferase [Metabacillus halosaccharovorans]